MNRIEFTHQITNLLAAMMLDREHPIGDFWKRSDEEQMRLFNAGLSDCDGIDNISPHQRGMALDIYFVEDDKLVDPKQGWSYWHNFWQEKGGKPLVILKSGRKDYGHFEG